MDAVALKVVGEIGGNFKPTPVYLVAATDCEHKFDAINEREARKYCDAFNRREREEPTGFVAAYGLAVSCTKNALNVTEEANDGGG